MPAGVHTAKRISDLKRQAIILAIANGEHKSATAARLRTAPAIVDIVLAEQWKEVEARKQILLAQAERNALEAGQQIGEALAQRKFPPGSLAVVYGISVDKSVALRPSDAPTSQHLHLHLSQQDIAGTFNSFLHSLQAKARTLPDPPSDPSTPPS